MKCSGITAFQANGDQEPKIAKQTHLIFHDCFREMSVVPVCLVQIKLQYSGRKYISYSSETFNLIITLVPVAGT